MAAVAPQAAQGGGDRGAGGPHPERELTEPVPLCLPDGRLNPDAIGWSRTPLHDGRLPGWWGRRKRWDFWGVTGPDCALNIVVADIDYLGIVDVWFHDFARDASATKSLSLPLAWNVRLPDRVGAAPIRFAALGLELSIVEEDAGTRLRVLFNGQEPFAADVLVRRPAGHESLGVVIPWGEYRYQYTNKDVARPAEGTVTWGDQRYELRADDGRSWGCLDYGRGRWPYDIKWNWGAGAGVVQGPAGPITVGVQLGGKWTDGTGMTENALCVNGRLTKVSEDLVWTYDPANWLAPWKVRTARTSQVDLTFTPIYDKVSRLWLGVLNQSVDQCFGTWSGTIVPDGGEPLAVDGLFGWAEEATYRW